MCCCRSTRHRRWRLKMIRKLVGVSLAAVLVLGLLAACGGTAEQPGSVGRTEVAAPPGSSAERTAPAQLSGGIQTAVAAEGGTTAAGHSGTSGQSATAGATTGVMTAGTITGGTGAMVNSTTGAGQAPASGTAGAATTATGMATAAAATGKPCGTAVATETATAGTAGATGARQ